MATTYDPYSTTSGTNYNELKNSINSAGNSYGAAKYSDPAAIGTLTQNYLKSMAPVAKATNDAIDQNTYNGMSALKEHMAQTGQFRGGTNNNRMMGLMNANTQAKGEASANMLNSAMGQATNIANLGLNEQNQIYTQKSTAADQLANLLSSQNSYNGKQTLAGQTNATNNASTIAGLTGMYDGAQTQDAKVAAATQAYNQGQLTLEQFKALLNYNVGVAGATDNLAQPTGFTYGDAMTNYLNSMYGLS